ncbi:hypothetical protein Tco_0381704 [Tanacetum coccineum]
MPNYYYRRVEHGETSKVDGTNDKPVNSKLPKDTEVVMKNSFEVLVDDETLEMSDETAWIHAKQSLNVINSDSEEVDQVIELETNPCMSKDMHKDERGQPGTSNVTEGASTPVNTVPDNSNVANVTVINQMDQAMHVRVWIKLDKNELFCSLVYAHNRYTQRRSLWENLCLHKHYVRNRSWCILGDFNAALYLEDSTAGSSRFDISMREFKECVEEIEVLDVVSTGLQFTWNQKPKMNDGILKKIDRVMVNLEFNDTFMGAHAIFMPYRISDHALAVLKIPLTNKMERRPFIFTNLLVHNNSFKNVVQEGWATHVSRFFMFQVVKKLKLLKKLFCKFELRLEEAAYLHAFNDALLMEERFLKQKSKIEWLNLGDSNTAYFHKAVKSRISRNRVEAVLDSNGALLTNDQVAVGFVKYYEEFLDQAGHTDVVNIDGLFHNVLDSVTALHMVRDVSANEVKEVMFSLGNDKSPGPDGYTAAFFKEAWDIVANDVTQAVQEFFQNGKLLREFNHTIIALIPKVHTPNRINDYRPISCCNVFFKCISKIISNRIKGSLNALISPNKSAFVSGRRISDNILFTQELMHNYHLDRGAPRCAFKVDIQKAYDTGKRGLRQGDPMSPYLFTLIMEVLTLMLHQRVRESKMFTYHSYCSKLELINLCFTDDLFLFAHGDVHSATVIMKSLNEFKLASGITSNIPKCTAYFCNVLNYVKIAILHVLPFEEGRLPVKYFGVPLTSSRLIYRDCRELIEKVRGRVNDWKNKSLSAADFEGVSMVSRAVEESTWSWPQEWFSKYPMLCSLVPPTISGSCDKLEWRTRAGVVKPFTVSTVWDCIRTHHEVIDWHDVVWFSNYVPSFSTQVWNQMKGLANLSSVMGGYKEVVDYLIPHAKSRSYKSVVAKLVLSASVYYIWQERNNRLFSNQKRTIAQLYEVIKSVVHLKILSCSFKKTRAGLEYVRLWGLLDSSFINTPR